MKATEYIKKYNLSNPYWRTDFKTIDFISDLARDFKVLTEVEKTTSNWNYEKFWDILVPKFLTKWDGINKKTMGCLPEYILDDVYDQCIYPICEKEFPAYYEMFDKIERMNEEEAAEFLQIKRYANHTGYGMFGTMEKIRLHKSDYPKGIPVLFVELAYKQLIKTSAANYKKQAQERYKQYEEEQVQRQANFIRYMLFMDSLFRTKIVPNESFLALCIPSTSTEDEINKAYRKLSLQHHPDKGGNADKFIALTEHKEKCLGFIKT